MYLSGEIHGWVRLWAQAQYEKKVTKSGMRREGFVVLERKSEEQKGKKAEKEAPNAGPCKGDRPVRGKPKWQKQMRIQELEPQDTADIWETDTTHDFHVQVNGLKNQRCPVHLLRVTISIMSNPFTISALYPLISLFRKKMLENV